MFFAGASAQAMQLSPQQKADMKLHYDKATRAYDVGKYQEAIEEYQKAYEIGGDAAMIYNIAQAYRLSDQLSEAIRFYRRYLQRSPSAPNREIVERRIAELEKVVDERKKAGAPLVPVAPTPAPTPISPIASTPPPPPSVPPPPVTEPPPMGAPVIPLEPAPVHSGNRTAHFVVGAVLLGVGAILGGASIWQGKIAQEKADKLSSESQSAGSIYFNPAVETNGKNANLVAIVLGSFSAATIVAGGIVLLTAPSSASSSSASPEATPHNSAPSVAPVIGVGYMGAQAGWSF
ncbi:MAG TPA: tetratricopeptide repeat protein [Polyangia bacterium]